jgi:ribonuclease BN (tRNA processing enzyme)
MNNALAAEPPIARPDNATGAANQHSTRVILLGTGGGPETRKFRSEPASLLVVDGRPYLIDCGAGVIRQLKWKGYEPEQIRTVFITHDHLDHTAGLGPLLADSWILGDINRGGVDIKTAEPVQIYGPKGTKIIVDGALDSLSVSAEIFNDNFGGKLKAVKGQFITHEIRADGIIYQDDRVRVTATENSHYHFSADQISEKEGFKSYALRFDTPAGSVVFTGDTGPSEAVAKLAKGADVLVSEVIDIPEIENVEKKSGLDPNSKAYQAVIEHMLREHLTPENVGKLARDAHVGMVLLNHLVPGRDDDTSDVAYTSGVKAYFDGPVILGMDLMEYDLYKSKD